VGGTRARSGLTVVLVLLLALGACGDGQDPRVADSSVLPLVERPQPPNSVDATPGSGAATVTIAPTASPTSTSTPTGTPSPAPSPTPSATVTPEPPATSEPADPPTEPPSEQEQLEAEVVELTNQERAAAGCGAVDVDDRLAAAARGHSEDMVARDFFDHVNPDGDGPGDRARAAGYDWLASENIAWGYRTAEDVVAGWMNSDGHRRNLLDCDVVAIGVGVADSSRGPYWTQKFGRR
jgi:uncharacterized protein YkwD